MIGLCKGLAMQAWMKGPDDRSYKEAQEAIRRWPALVPFSREATKELFAGWSADYYALLDACTLRMS